MRHITLAIAILFSSQASAQAPQCGERAAIISQLSDKFGESQQAVALTAQNAVMEFWANDTTGTWTALLSDHSGRSCIIATGADWELVPAPPSPMGGPV